MKKLLSICLTLIMWSARAQTVLPHQPEHPPVNPHGTFMRSMVTDCTDDIVSDMINGNALGLKQDLFDYIATNYIEYVAMDGLSQTLGNSTAELFLRQLLYDLHSTFPGIQLGAIGSSAADFQSTLFKVNVDFKPACDQGAQSSNIYLDPKQTRLAEVNQHLLLAASLPDRQKAAAEKKCMEGFDVLVLDDRFWQHYTDMSDAQNLFRDYLSTLEFMKKLKCSYGCIKFIDAIFLPITEYGSLGWTATDQITAVDPLAERIILPAFTNNAGRVYETVCWYFHLFTDRFTKDRSRIFIGCSAESLRFTLCIGTTGNDHLGDFLDQTGNMYSVEKIMVDQLNDPTYTCSYCSCNTNATNQYSITNRKGNELMGSMWFYYSIVKTNRLYRSPQESGRNPIKVRDVLGRQ